MLAELRIRDLAILEKVELSFSSGLNVISGETGEGKSLLLLAVTLLLGERSRRGLVRAGTKEATIEGRFALDRETAARCAAINDQVSPEATELVLRRVVAEDGTSRASIDGSLATLTMVARLALELVDLHAQGQTHALERTSERARMLDRFGDCTELAVAYREARGAWQAAEKRRADILARAEDRERRLDFLRFQVQELEEADPKQGEETEVVQSLKLASRRESLAQVFREIDQELSSGDSSLCDHLARWRRALTDVQSHASLQGLPARLLALATEVRDLAASAATLGHRLAEDEESLPALEERLSTLRKLARKHRVDGDQLGERRHALRAEITAAETEEAEAGALSEHSADHMRRVREAAEVLLVARQDAARRLERMVSEGLQELRMERAQFRIEIAPDSVGSAWVPPEGDQPGEVRFLVAANPGEPEQPIERVASGGELARILLAIKSALAGVQRVPLLVFDEIDAGIGGRVGLPFGRRIAAIAKHHQVLVVTHLPQVAAFADRHFRVKKAVLDGRTRTEVSVLNSDQRVIEIAEMLGLDAQDSGARKQSKALLQEAQN